MDEHRKLEKDLEKSSKDSHHRHVAKGKESLPTHGFDPEHRAEHGGPSDWQHVPQYLDPIHIAIRQKDIDADETILPESYQEETARATPRRQPQIDVRLDFLESATRNKNPFVSLAHGDISSDLDEASYISDKLADLSLIEDRIFPKADFIAQWQDVANTVEDDAEMSSIGTTYRSCIDCYRAMLPEYYRALKGNPASQETLYRNCVLLHDWGVAYSVSNGQLDQLPPEAADMTDAILSFLAEISTILIQRLPRLIGHELSVGKSMRAERLVVKSVPLVNPANTSNEVSASSADAEDLDTEDDTWEQCLTELHDYIVLLHELHPSIESWVSLHEINPEPKAQDDLQHVGSHFYASMVKAKFHNAPESLVDTLGALNYDRYTRLASERHRNLGESEQIQETTTTESSFDDSGIGSSLPQSEMGTFRSQTPSKASSIAFTLAGQSRTRFPQLPKDARYRPYLCDFCGITVSFKTKKGYESHLLHDLRPYSCLEAECTSANESFRSREDWIQHLQEAHNLQPNSPARPCKLCGEVTGPGMIAICRHFAEHLEAIALAASPMDIAPDDDSDADSTKSHGHERNEDNELHTIAEESEDTIVLPSKGIPGLAQSKAWERGLYERPNCAICNSTEIDCPCESERLVIAVKQAEQRAMSDRLGELRDWVINHSRQHVLKAFESLTSVRKQAHASYLASLPHYDVYMQHSGHPPIAHIYVATLQSQIAEAHGDLKRGIDSDWRASVSRYPVLLDYFYSLVELRLPSDESQEVVQPPFAAAGYADRGYDRGYIDSALGVEKVKKKRRDREGSVGPERHAQIHRLLRGPPPAPTPPLQHGGYRRPPDPYC